MEQLNDISLIEKELIVIIDFSASSCLFKVLSVLKVLSHTEQLNIFIVFPVVSSFLTETVTIVQRLGVKKPIYGQNILRMGSMNNTHFFSTISKHMIFYEPMVPLKDLLRYLTQLVDVYKGASIIYA